MKIKDKNELVEDVFDIIDTSIELYQYNKIKEKRDLSLLEDINKQLLGINLKLTIKSLLKQVI